MIARINPTHYREDVLLTVVSEIGKTNGVALLQMAESPGGGYILKEFALRIPKHAVRNHRCQTRVPRAEVKVQPAIVFQIPKVAAHRLQHVIEMGRFSDVAKSSVMIVVIEFRGRAMVGLPEIIGGDIGYALNP